MSDDLRQICYAIIFAWLAFSVFDIRSDIYDLRDQIENKPPTKAVK